MGLNIYKVKIEILYFSCISTSVTVNKGTEETGDLTTKNYLVRLTYCKVSFSQLSVKYRSPKFCGRRELYPTKHLFSKLLDAA